jgi:preprotein translocase subunit YajC
MLISPAYAQAAGSAVSSGGGTSAMIASFAPIALVFVVFWFLILRPQQKKQREHAAAINAVKKGQPVVTAGGIMGRVTKVEDTVVEVEIAPNTRVRVVKSTLTQVGGGDTAKPAND